MCYLCRFNLKLTPEQVIAQLKEPVDYDEFNTTSIGFILYSCVGMNGPEAKEVALDVLDKFITWVKTKLPYYVPDTDIEPMLHPNVLVKLHKWCVQFTNPNSLSNDELINLLGRKIHEFKRIQENWEFWTSFGIGIGIGIGAIAIGEYLKK